MIASTAIVADLIGPWDCSIEEYHEDRDFVSHSSLELFRKSPRLYKMWFDWKWERQITPEFRDGFALHSMVLEEDTFDSRFVAIDCASRNTKIYQEMKAKEKREILLRPEFETVAIMASAIMSHPVVADLISKARKEKSYRFIDPLSDVPCKIRPDGITDSIMFDLKTSRDPSEESWIRDAARFGYHRQADSYMTGLREADPFHPETEFLHIVVGSVQPHDVFLYQLNAEALALGGREIEQSLLELRDRRETNNWREKNYGKIVPVSLPKWYLAKGWED